MSWGKYGITDWSVKALRLAPLNAVAATLGEALNERYFGTRNTDDGTFPPLFDYTIGNIEPANLIKEFDTLMFERSDGFTPALYQRYCNHTDNGGEWDKTVDGPPLWTEEAMLSALGQGSFYRIQDAFCPVNAEWANQMYRIINMLRWTRHLAGADYLATGVYKYSSGATYQAAVAGWPAAWSPSSSSLWANVWSQLWYPGYPDEYRLYRSYLTSTYASNTVRFNRNDELYVFARAVQNDNYDDNGTGFERDRYNSFITRNGVSGKYYFDLRDSLSGDAPAAPQGSVVGDYTGFTFSVPTLVSKFDVEGGFVFID